jgi:membrane protein
MKNKILQFWDSVWSSENELQGKKLGSSFRALIRLFFAATDRFRKDEDLIRAASISYALVVSLIPTLIVGLLLAANFINIKDYEELAKEYVRKNGIPMDISAYFKIIYELLNNTAALTGIGFLFVLFSTTSVLRNLEDAMNKIWHVKRKRPFIQKVAEFVMIIIFGPVLLAIGLTTGQSLLNEFSAPGLTRMEVATEQNYIVGEKRVLLSRTPEGNWTYLNILDKIDYDFQKDPIIFDPETNKVLSAVELQPIQHRVKRASKQDLRVSNFTDISVQGEQIFIITDNGTLIFSRDGGNFWQARKFQRKQLNILLKASFTRIFMFDENTGLILGKGGIILRTEDAGETWKPFFTPYVRTDLNDIAQISETDYLVVGEEFTALVTSDFGRTWRPFAPLVNMNSFEKENLHSIAKAGESVFICGDAGAILTSRDSGRTWYKKNIGLKKIDYFDIAFVNEQSGIMVGDSGNIRFTTDGGVVWKMAKSPTDQDLRHISFDPKENRFFILGENYLILANQPGDYQSFKILEQTPFWRIGITALGKFFLPFFVLWLIFFFVYQILPFTYVKFKPAAIGAFCTSLALVIFIIGFQYYVSFFSAGKFAIYGTLAAIPLALLLIYVSTIIVLYGCEVTYLIQHPELIRISYAKRNFEELEKHQIWKGIQILHFIHSKFLAGKGETLDSELLKFCQSDQLEFERIMAVYAKNQYVAKTEDGGWAPLKAAESITLDELIDILSPAGFDITDYDPKMILAKEIRPIFEEYAKARKEIFKSKTLRSLL